MEQLVVIVPAILSGIAFLWHNSMSFVYLCTFFQAGNIDDGSVLVQQVGTQKTIKKKKQNILLSLFMYPFQLAGSVLLMWDVNHGTYGLTLSYLLLATLVSLIRIVGHVQRTGIKGLKDCIFDSSVYGITFGTIALGCNLLMSYYQIPAGMLCTVCSLVIYNWHFYWISVIQGFSYLDYVVPMLPLFLETNGFLSSYDAQLVFIYNLFLVCANTENNRGSLMLDVRKVKLARLLSDRQNCVRKTFDLMQNPLPAVEEDELHVTAGSGQFTESWYHEYIGVIPQRHYTLLETLSYICMPDRIKLSLLERTWVGRDSMTEFYHRYNAEIYTCDNQKKVSYSFFYSEFFGVSIRWTNNNFKVLDEVSKHKLNAIQSCIAYLNQRQKGKEGNEGGRFKHLKQRIYEKFLEHEKLMGSRNDYQVSEIVIPKVYPYKREETEKIVDKHWIIPKKDEETVTASVDLSIMTKIAPVLAVSDKALSNIVASKRSEFPYRTVRPKRNKNKVKEFSISAYKTYVLKSLSNNCKMHKERQIGARSCADIHWRRGSFKMAVEDKKSKGHKNMVRILRDQWSLISGYNPTKRWEGSSQIGTCLALMKLWDLKWLFNGTMYLYNIDTSCADLNHLIQNKRPIRNHFNKGRKVFHLLKEIF